MTGDDQYSLQHGPLQATRCIRTLDATENVTATVFTRCTVHGTREPSELASLALRALKRNQRMIAIDLFR